LGGGWTGNLRLPERCIALDQIGCAYYRRPTVFEFPNHLSDEERRWALREARSGVGGVLAELPRWLNHPVDIGRAEYKPVQLARAEAVGLTVPDTLITNDPDEARSFVSAAGQAVYKPLGGGGIAEEGVHKLVYANQLTADVIDDSVRGTAHLFQKWVPKAYEVRLTVVDHEFFGIRIDSDSEIARVDWRTDYPALRYSVIEVPELVRVSVWRLMRQLRLRFGALDFVLGPDGAWTFLEINPNGQWAWLQDATGLPIAAAIADALTREDA
jgi:ATP-grasp ribosomal peptide maturase